MPNHYLAMDITVYCPIYMKLNLRNLVSYQQLSVSQMLYMPKSTNNTSVSDYKETMEMNGGKSNRSSTLKRLSKFQVDKVDFKAERWY